MAKEIGLSRKIKLAWLNQTVALINEGLSEEELKSQLNEYLSFEISSAINVRKTREILMRIWAYQNQYTDILRPVALDLAASDSVCKAAIHWCMMLAAYPFFMDIGSMIGKMLEFQDEIALSQLRQKMFDEWGERTTLYHSTDKMIATLKEFGVLENVATGRYRIIKHDVTDTSLILFMILTVMCVEGKSYYTMQDIKDFSCLFPFDYDIAKSDMIESRFFSSTNFGGELTFALYSQNI